MDFPGRFSATLLLLGYLGWLFCKEWRSGVSSAAGEAGPGSAVVSGPMTFDSFLHNQQLRKKLLRSFCNQGPKVNRLRQPSYFSRLRVNERHELVYCSVPDVGPANWDQMLKTLNSLPGQVEKIVNETAPLQAPHENLSHYDMTTIKSLLASYTKIIFIRDPLWRLLSTYHHHGATEEPFEAFVQRVLGQELKPAASWKPLVELCHPCLVRYDYVIVHGLLDQEMRHLLRRIGISEEVELPKFQDLEESLTSQVLKEQHFGQLSAQLMGKLFQFYHRDFAAFNFTNGSILN
ncbi:carbohydrate sulfotransferase 9-like isoform X1 [Heterodontus francisci]|uniref:carbohydrate sulfotransferase 9-like isoform X1 n=1 Tax=Heterodontus francisci TaxID=7792 RepID=UPI00355BFB00